MGWSVEIAPEVSRRLNDFSPDVLLSLFRRLEGHLGSNPYTGVQGSGALTKYRMLEMEFNEYRERYRVRFFYLLNEQTSTAHVLQVKLVMA